MELKGQPSRLRIIQELFNGERQEWELTDEQFMVLKQIRTAYGLLIDMKSNKYIVSALMIQYDTSQASAYRIIRDAKTIFGDITRTDKDWSRHMAIEMAKQCYRIALKLGRVKDMIAATKAYIEASGLTRDDADIPDFEKIQPSLVVTVLPEGMEEEIRSLLKQGAINLNKAVIEDIEHEEIESGRTDQTGNTKAAR